MKSIIRLLFVSLLLAVGTISALAEDFYYKTYDVTVQVHQDNSYSVCESMDAFFTAPKHGIVREWYTSSYLKRMLPGEDGKPVEKVMCYTPSIQDIQCSENSVLDTESSLALRIGSEDVYVEGDHHYQIDYNYIVGDDRTTIDDVFYFSLLGNANETNTEEFTFAVRFDKPVPQEYLKQIKLFYGHEGDSINKADKGLTFVSDTLITGHVSGLNAYEAVSLYLPLPEGYYTPTETYDYEGAKNAFWLLLAISALMVLPVLVRETRPRNNFTKVIEYWPPKELSPADLGYIYDTTVDPCDIISLIPYFAHKGLLTIDTTQGHPILTKKKAIDETAPAYQKKLFNAFFAESVKFDSANPPEKFAEAWLEMDAEIKKANTNIPNEYSWFYMFLISLGSLLMIINMFMCDPLGTSGLGFYGLGIWGIMAYIGLTSLRVWDDTAFSKVKRGALIFTWVLAIGLQLACFSEMRTDNEVYMFKDTDTAIGIVYVLYLFAALFNMRLSHMGKARLKYIGHILGLKEFIEKSEKPLLDSLIKEHETYFYDILPYAVAFGLSEKWAKQFEGLNVKPADWYTGNDLSTMAMCHNMNANKLYTSSMQQSVHHLTSERAKASASSGSGGGFSGGGFGGGGSHSW